MNRRAQTVLLLATLAISLAGASTALSQVGRFSSTVWGVISGVTGALLAVASSALLGRRSATRRVFLSVIGAPGVGKSVYVNVLFDQLQYGLSRNAIAPASETVNRVTETMNAFASGNWIEATLPEYLHLYRARVRVDRRALVDRLTGPGETVVEVADAAGEQLAEFVPGTSSYAAKTSYYRYALEADGLLLMLDFPTVAPGPTEGRRSELERQVNELIFVVQTVCEEHDVAPGEFLNLPVAVLITKCDMIEGFGSVLSPREVAEDLLDDSEPLERLTKVLKTRCRAAQVFCVSSTGPLSNPDQPPKRVRPIGIIDPFDWLLAAVPRHSESRVVRKSRVNSLR